MQINNNSLAVVFVGDWNKLYTEPDWIAQNIIQQKEIEIRVNFNNNDASFLYIGKNVVIEPKTNKVVFTAKDSTPQTVESLINYVSNFLLKAKSPANVSYGLNLEFSEENSMTFADYLDSLPDTRCFTEAGYEIKHTEIKRTVLSGDVLLNIDFKMNGRNVLIHFNEHHESLPKGEAITKEGIAQFTTRAQEIITALGYSLEDDSDD